MNITEFLKEHYIERYANQIRVINKRTGKLVKSFYEKTVEESEQKLVDYLVSR